MIKDSAKELFEIVLVWKLDRFSRDRYDSAHYKHILKKNGVKVISAKELSPKARRVLFWKQCWWAMPSSILLNYQRKSIADRKRTR